jgi:hypothetical protein
MDGAKLGRTLIGLGAAGLALSFLWWLIFFGQVNQAFGGRAGDLAQALQCLWSISGPCGFVTAMAGAAGMFAYQPMFFWISVVALVAGLVVASSAGAEPSATASSSARYDVAKWKALTELDPEIAAAVAEVEPYGSLAVTELATKYLAVNDKQYLAAIVKQITDKYRAQREAQTDGEETYEYKGRRIVKIGADYFIEGHNQPYIDVHTARIVIDRGDLDT